MRKIVEFSNGDRHGVDETQLERLVAANAVNVLVADYIEIKRDSDGNPIPVEVVSVDGKPWPPVKAAPKKSEE